MPAMLKVSDNRRFLVHVDGRPFFYLADTAWELFHRPGRADALAYLRNRAAKGFTVIQAVALAEEDGLNTPNANGDRPLIDNDPAKPNEPYWQHVDWVIDQAAALGMYTALLPTWGDKWNGKWGIGPLIFNPQNAFAYGQWIGRRYADRPIIWVMGGDRPVETDEHRQIVEAMSRGVRESVGNQQLMTFHPCGQRGSSEFVHDAPWLDLHMRQTGHWRNSDNYNKIAHDYALSPTRPVIDAEPGYEDHPSHFKLDDGYLDDYDVRKSLYWSVFAGACGYTYGCHPIWAFWTSAHRIKSFMRREWTEAMHLPGSGQVRHGKALIESRPVLGRIPDQAMIVSENPGGSYHLQATRDAEGRYAFVYTPYWNEFTLDLSHLRASTLAVHWFDPRTGATTRAADAQRGVAVTFQPPVSGPDWVLVLDDPSCDFEKPGVL
jgi:hypothetical protein